MVYTHKVFKKYVNHLLDTRSSSSKFVIFLLYLLYINDHFTLNGPGIYETGL